MLTVLMLLVLTFVRVVQPAETWHYGMRDGDLITYTADGTEKTALSDAGSVEGGWRIDEQTALFLLEMDDAAHLYRVSPDEATEIQIPDGVDASDYRLTLASGSNHLLLSSSVRPSPALLVNAADAQAELLDAMVAYTARISSDGTLLRYMRFDDENVWSLIERTLASGEEQTLYQFDAPDELSTFFYANDEGDHWLYNQVDNGQIANVLFGVDGNRLSLDGIGVVEEPAQWQRLDDTLIASSRLCISECQMFFRPIGIPPFPFNVPFSSYGVTALAQPTLESLFVIRGNEFWLLQKDEEPFNLGSYDAVHMATPIVWLVSPDQRYVLAKSGIGDSEYLVWDLTTAATVALVNTETGVTINYFDEGFIVSTFGRDGEAVAYRYEDGSNVSLPNGGSGVYFALLPDGGLLYSLSRENEAVGERGIYRYDPADKSYALLVEDTVMVNACRCGR